MTHFLNPIFWHPYHFIWSLSLGSFSHVMRKDSFYNYRCIALLQSVSAEGDSCSARRVWGRRTCVINSQWFKLLKFFFLLSDLLKGNEKSHLSIETHPQSQLMLTPCTHKRADKESLVSLMESQVRSLHPFLLKSALYFKVVLLY